jgi:hypothetical protein
MSTRGTSNSDYEAYRATHLTDDHVTLSQASPKGKAGLKGAAHALSVGLSCYAPPPCFTIDQGATLTMAGAPVPLREVRPRGGTCS